MLMHPTHFYLVLRLLLELVVGTWVSDGVYLVWDRKPNPTRSSKNEGTGFSHTYFDKGAGDGILIVTQPHKAFTLMQEGRIYSY
jgi:hypothetical protein